MSKEGGGQVGRSRGRNMEGDLEEEGKRGEGRRESWEE